MIWGTCGLMYVMGVLTVHVHVHHAIIYRLSTIKYMQMIVANLHYNKINKL